IREIAAIEKGFLVIAGNSGSEPGDRIETEKDALDWDPKRGFYLYFWDGGTGIQEIGKIPRDDKGYKAEGMMLLDEGESSIDVLVLYDGPAGGKPTVYRICKNRD
ncbi:MAG: hypothetical protein ACYTE8_07825, partial [Planctomycetota bacterium]